MKNWNVERHKRKVVNSFNNIFSFFFSPSYRPSSADLLGLLSYYKLLLLCEHIKMSRSPDAKEDPVECPLCMEPLEIDDINFFPCTCGYQICRFCWHRIRTDENGLCPACRKVNPWNSNLSCIFHKALALCWYQRHPFPWGKQSSSHGLDQEWGVGSFRLCLLMYWSCCGAAGFGLLNSEPYW